MPVSSKEFLKFQATIEYRFTLKRVRDMVIIYSQLNLEYGDIVYEQVSHKYFIEKLEHF